MFDMCSYDNISVYGIDVKLKQLNIESVQQLIE